MNKKYGIVFVFLFLIVGFAAVTSNLLINNQVKVAESDFDVYFSGAYEWKSASRYNQEDYGSISISEDKKTVNYSSHRITNIGNYVTIAFDIFNDSLSYDADVYIDLELNDDVLEYVDVSHHIYINGYYLKNLNDHFIIPPMTTQRGEITFTLKKTSSVEKQLNFTARVYANPVGKTIDKYRFSSSYIPVYNGMGVIKTCGYDNRDVKLYNYNKRFKKLNYLSECESYTNVYSGYSCETISAGTVMDHDFCSLVIDDYNNEVIYDRCDYLSEYKSFDDRRYMIPQSHSTPEILIEAGETVDSDMYFAVEKEQIVVYEGSDIDCTSFGCQLDEEGINTNEKCVGEGIYIDFDDKRVVFPTLGREYGRFDNEYIKNELDGVNIEYEETDNGWISIPSKDLLCAYVNGSTVRCVRNLLVPPCGYIGQQANVSRHTVDYRISDYIACIY